MNDSATDLAHEMALDNLKAIDVIHKGFTNLLEISVNLLKNVKEKEAKVEAERLQRIEGSANISNSFREILSTRDSIKTALTELATYVSLPVIELDEEQAEEITEEITEENTAPTYPIYNP